MHRESAHRVIDAAFDQELSRLDAPRQRRPMKNAAHPVWVNGSVAFSPKKGRLCLFFFAH
jgi:hypothetical protein